MAVVVDRLESAVEGVVDGMFRQAFRGRLQPLEIARRLTRHAEEAKVISLNRVYVPNAFVVGLNPEEMASIAPFAPDVQAELERFVGEWIAERDYTVNGPTRVELREHEGLGPGRMRVTVSVVTVPPPEEEAVTGVYTGPCSHDTYGRLHGEEGPEAGRQFQLFGGRTVLGRAVDSDVQLRDPLVSRYHAAMEWREGAWWIQDLDSTNGLRLNDQEVREVIINDGDRIRLGNSIFRVELRDVVELPELDEPDVA
jgi:hypothetical protein